MLWQRVRDLMPRRLRPDKDVFPRSRARVPIYGSHHHLTNYTGVRACQSGSAPFAEAPCVSWGRLITLDKILAGGPSEGSGIQDAPSCERSTIRLPTPGAVTVAEELERCRDFVPNSTTEAASLNGHCANLQ